MKRNTLFVLAGAILLASLVAIFLGRNSGVANTPIDPPKVSPTPCLVEDVGSAPPPDICHDRCGDFFHGVPQGQHNNQDVLCCPDGTVHGKTIDGQNTCVKAP